MKVETLRQDPSIILTAVHAYAVNDLEVEPDIKQLLIENLDLIKQIPKEKAYAELKNIMGTLHPDRYIREFKEIFFALIPGLEQAYGFNQNNPWHIYDVFEHTMHVIDNTEPNEILRIAALFHDLGKPFVYSEETKTREDGTTYQHGHFYNHARVSSIMFEEFAKQMKIPEEEKNLISKLIIFHDYQLSTKPEKIKQYIETLGVENIPLLFALKRADNLSQNREKSEQVLQELDRTEKIFMDYISKLPKKEQPQEEHKKKTN